MELHEPVAVSARDLAGAFLAELGDRATCWPALLAPWCDARGISPDLRAEIRATVQRARIVQAVERHGGAA